MLQTNTKLSRAALTAVWRSGFDPFRFALHTRFSLGKVFGDSNPRSFRKTLSFSTSLNNSAGSLKPDYARFGLEYFA